MTTEPSIWTLGRTRRALRRYWVIIVGFFVIGGVGGYGLSSMETPLYQASSALAFSTSRVSTAADLANGSMYVQGQMQTFSQLTTSSAVLQPVIDELKLDTTLKDLTKSIVVTNPQKSLILQITVSSPSPERSAELANAIAKSLTKVVRSTSPSPVLGSSPNVDASLVDTAVAPRHQSSPNKSKDALLSAFGGLVIGLALVVLLAVFDSRVFDGEELRRVARIPLLGSVPKVARGRRELVTTEPDSPLAIQFRRVRSTLKHLTEDQSSRRILVTSPRTGEGSTTVSVDLALTLAVLGDKVLLIDADLRHPGVAARLGLEDAVGLTTVLTGGSTLAAAIRHDEASGLDILTCGEAVADPAGLLASGKMQELLDEVVGGYDFVIIDSPSTLDTADVNLLAPQIDGAVVVVNANRTKHAALSGALANLNGAGGHVIGAVLNCSRRGMSVDTSLVSGDSALPRRSEPEAV